MDGKIHHYCYAIAIFVEESKQRSHLYFQFSTQERLTETGNRESVP